MPIDPTATRINYTLVRTNNNRFQLEVKPDCSVIVRAPQNMAQEQIDIIVHNNADKIRAAQEKIRLNNPEKKSRKAIPPEFQDRYETIAALLASFCETYLNDEYMGLCIHALDLLARNYYLTRGKDATWAAGIVYAIAQNCELLHGGRSFYLGVRQFDITGDMIASFFGVSKGGTVAKAKSIRDDLGISQKSEWLTQKQAEGKRAWSDFNRAMNKAMKKR